MMLPDFSAKKHKKNSAGRWPSGFRPIGEAGLVKATAISGFEPSIKHELSQFPHLPRFDLNEQTSFSAAPAMDALSFDDDTLNFDAPLPADPDFENLMPEEDQLFSGEDTLSEFDETPSLDLSGGAMSMLDDEPPLAQNNIAEDGLQRVLDQIDGAVHAAMEPLKFELNQSILAGFQSVLRKSIEADGKQRIVDFISTLVPTGQDLVATIKGPALLIEGLQGQLETAENLPVKLKFVEDDGLLDIVVTYDSASVSTRLAEFEAMIAELG